MGDNVVKRMIVTCALAVGMVITSPVFAQSVAAGSAPALARSTRVTVDADHAPLVSVLQTIARQANLRVVWDNTVFDNTARVTVHMQSLPADEAFAKVLTGTGIRAEFAAGHVAFVKDVAAGADGRIEGTVVDGRSKQPLRGVQISLDGAQHGVTSDDAGHFRISNVSAGSHTVQLRRLGYVKVIRTITVTDGQSSVVDVVLEGSVSTLDQVVVTGTVIPTELKAVPNAITVITADQIEKRGITQITQLFRGDVPGLFAVNVGSQSGLDTVTMFSRGATSIQGASSSAPIKTYVDGIELANPIFLNQIDPRSIERIEILTGPQASTIYGSNAINGVMQIFTKRGTGTKPRLSLSLMSGVIQIKASSALAPRHDASGQIDGIEGRMSYNMGGGWRYIGPWSPMKQENTLSGFGGVHFQVPLGHGTVIADASMRLSTTQNRSHDFGRDELIANIETGTYAPPSVVYGMSSPRLATLSGQTLGGTLTYTPTSWMSHTIELGSDVSTVQTSSLTPIYSATYDTTLSLSQSQTRRNSLRYTASMRVSVTTIARLALTVGGDAWQSLTTSLSNSSLTSLTGTLGGSPSIARQPSHNAGAFGQGQLGIGDALFFTYGLRAEWNPNYGADAEPNVTPRYGLAYTQDIGMLTAKVRASYGRATRPPTVMQKIRRSTSEVGAFYRIAPNFYGPFDAQRANPDLNPEYQHGGEGGVELYWGSRASLVVTRYNQLVDGLIVPIYNDSVRTLLPNVLAFGSITCNAIDAAGYCYLRTFQNINVASIRNSGWELQHSLTTGPLVTKLTYSWTKSRVVGLTDGLGANQVFGIGSYNLTRGASFGYLPEHTWGIGTTYTNATTVVSVNVNGVGSVIRSTDPLTADVGYDRLDINRPREDVSSYTPRGAGYALIDLNVSQRLTSHVNGVVQVQNLGNFYQNDYGSIFSTAGRQTNVGVRMTF